MKKTALAIFGIFLFATLGDGSLASREKSSISSGPSTGRNEGLKSIPRSREELVGCIGFLFTSRKSDGYCQGVFETLYWLS